MFFFLIFFYFQFAVLHTGISTTTWRSTHRGVDVGNRMQPLGHHCNISTENYLGCDEQGRGLRGLHPPRCFNPLMPNDAFNICCLRDCVSRHNGGTSGAPIMPRDAVSRTTNVERTGRHKWVPETLFRRKFMVYM